MTVITVSQLNAYVKSILDGTYNLKTVYLRGEISNLTDHYRSGHIYLTLKDEKAAIKAVMFAGSAKYLRFRPEDGMSVLIRGRVSLYEATGAYQLYIDEMQPDGIGALSVAYEQLKKRLSQEGLFSEEHKKPLPAFPKRIGVITSPTGAALQDICRILKRRYPIAEVVLCPVLVQGEGAAEQLTEAVRRFNRIKCADVIIIGRGGGSIEDLWAFNDEGLARAVYDSDIPIVSAVGHETDFTICDFAADVRASTPSAGAELVSPELEGIKYLVSDIQRRMGDSIKVYINKRRQQLDGIVSCRVMRSPYEYINYRKIRLDSVTSDMTLAFTHHLRKKQERFTYLGSRLDALSPLSVLGRGFSVVKLGSKTMTSVKNIKAGDNIKVVMRDGALSCRVEERTEEQWQKNSTTKNQ